MDRVTGAEVTVAMTVPVLPERMFDLVTDVGRIGEWSPEVIGGTWYNGVEGPAPGARFIGRNRFPTGVEATVTCVVTASERPATFAWQVLDDDGLVGSAWRYELSAGVESGSTVVRHMFTHGPGLTGARAAAEVDPRALTERLAVLARNMTTTIDAMADADRTTGANR